MTEEKNFRVCAFQVKVQNSQNGFWDTNPKVNVRCALTSKGGLDSYPLNLCLPDVCPIYQTWKCLEAKKRMGKEK
jgi:hypothetical protein